MEAKNKSLKCESIVYSLCVDVFQNKAYSSIALNKRLGTDDLNYAEKSYVTSFFYSVLDYSVQFDYIISSLAAKKPKPSAVILIKMGLYLLRYSQTPPYAAVDKIVELTKQVGKGGMSGFINAVLKKSSNVALPEIKDNKSLSIVSSTPLWAVEKLSQNYSFDFTRELLLYKGDNLTHIRVNRLNISSVDFEAKYATILDKTSKYGYYVTHSTIEKISKYDYIVQSLSSISAVNYLYEKGSKSILDLCSAPGGKAVLLYELGSLNSDDSKITACDIHPHRVELIKKYIQNAGAVIDVLQNDATALKNEWIGKFDFVLCDVPCSGVGVFGSKPEIFFNKTEENSDLLALQKNILETSKNYVKSGGFLCYSTCTLFKDENDGVLNEFLSKNADFELCAEPLCLFPHIDRCDGFFAAKMKRIR